MKGEDVDSSFEPEKQTDKLEIVSFTVANENGSGPIAQTSRLFFKL